MSWVLVNYVAMDLEIYISLQVNIFVFFGQIPRNGIAPSQVALVVKNPATNSGNLRDTGSIPVSRSSPGGGWGNPLPYSCLENPMDRRAWRATVHGVAKSWTWLKRLATSHGSSIFNFLRNLHIFHSDCANHNPTNSTQRFPFLHILANTWCFLFDNSHSNRCKVIFHCGFDLHFPDY